MELDGVDVNAALDAVALLRRSLVDAAGVSDDALDGAVVGVPGVVDAPSGVVRMTSVPGLDGMAFGHEAERVLGLPVAVENDINLAAVGEHWLGVARGVDDFVFLSVERASGQASSCTVSCTAGDTVLQENSISSRPASATTSTRAPAPCPSFPRGSPSATAAHFSCPRTTRLPCFRLRARATRLHVRS